MSKDTHLNEFCVPVEANKQQIHLSRNSHTKLFSISAEKIGQRFIKHQFITMSLIQLQTRANFWPGFSHLALYFVPAGAASGLSMTKAAA